jgi:hypothetical protein
MTVLWDIHFLATIVATVCILKKVKNAELTYAVVGRKSKPHWNTKLKKRRRNTAMPNITSEQIVKAKQIYILDYLMIHEPQNLKKVGNRYTLLDHDSFVISNDKWCWNSRGIGSNTATALNYLIKVRGYSFTEAVQELSEDMPPNYAHIEPELREKSPFILPPRNSDNNRVIAYLQSRGIDRETINECINWGSLYESSKTHYCVFTGKNSDGKTRFACLRATLGKFRRDADGSDKRYGFLLPPKTSNSRNIAVFESPINCLSHQSLCKQGYFDWDGWRLSLSGNSLAALVYFIEQHPEADNCLVCTDNDEAGNLTAEKIAVLPKENANFAHVTVTRSVPKHGKDYNDELQEIRRISSHKEKSHENNII